jgi:hypothetical protein
MINSGISGRFGLDSVTTETPAAGFDLIVLSNLHETTIYATLSQNYLDSF